tara:strand:+ start:537 stop:911 length:375 start_codon:yes stop_codon:yes gene_type:complete
MRYQIKTKCDECDGYGKREHPIAADDFLDRECEECNSTGFVIIYDTYDSEADALADYPDSLVRPTLSPMLQGLQELFDKLATVPLSSDQQRDTIEREALNHKESIHELAQHNAELQRRLGEYER